MADADRQDVTLSTLHGDLAALGGEMTAVRVEMTGLRGEMTGLRGETREGFADLKTTLVAGFRSLPSRESSDEMIRLLREANRLHEERFTQVDLRLREQHLEAQQTLHAVAEGLRLLVDGQRVLVEGQRVLVEGQRSLHEEQRQLSADIRALIARIDALIRGRDNGNPDA